MDDLFWLVIALVFGAGKLFFRFIKKQQQYANEKELTREESFPREEGRETPAPRQIWGDVFRELFEGDGDKKGDKEPAKPYGETYRRPPAQVKSVRTGKGWVLVEKKAPGEEHIYLPKPVEVLESPWRRGAAPMAPVKPGPIPRGSRYAEEHQEGIAGLEGMAGVEGAADLEGTSGTEGIAGKEGFFGRKNVAATADNPPVSENAASGYPSIQITDAAQGILWAEILGKPKALRGPLARGPRS